MQDDARPAASASLTPQATFAALAITTPTLLAWNVSPSPTFLNQALALALWGVFVLALRPAAGTGAASVRAVAAPLAALGLVGVGVLWSTGPGSLPAGLGLSALGLLGAAALVMAAGAAAQAGGAARRPPALLFGDVCIGFAVAAGVNLGLALVQVFAPALADGDVIAISGYPGRAVGNLRQPNHLSSLLVWGCVAVVALVELRRLPRRAGTLLLTALVFGVVLTASRTGTVGMLLLAFWGLVDRRLSRPTRGLLLAAPLLYALAWFGMAEWAKLADETFGGAARLSEAESPNSRPAIWRDTLALIAAQPWAGVGFGEFNFAWSLSVFPQRPTAFFDHTHNLPLHLAVELGVPAAAAICALLLAALVQVAGRARADARAGRDDDATARRAALALLVLIGLHSLLEYPLWYAYFLLPTAWVWGFALGRRAERPPSPGASPALVAGGVVLVVATVLSVLDYTRVAAVFASSERPLAQRIAAGQRSVFFAHHADYAAATTASGAGSLAPFARATHYLLDTRLMIAWARALHAAGDTERAAWIAARLREFRNPGAEDFFEPCGGLAAPPAAASSAAFPCAAPGAALGWRDFSGPTGGR